MKNRTIAILAQEESPTITNELRPAIEHAGDTVDVLDISHLTLNNLLEDPVIKNLSSYDIVYYRTGVASDILALIEPWLRSHGVICINLNFSMHPYATAKTYQVLLVANNTAIPTPHTLHDKKSTFAVIADRLGAPFVAKANISSQGKDVHLITNQSDLDTIEPDRELLKYFFQSYIPHKSEYRVHVVGDTAPAMYQRIPAAGDFRSNVSRGGSMVPVEAEYKEQLESLALEVANLFSFEICAVDFMRHTESNEFYFTEINFNPGWEISDQDATGVDLSLRVSEYLQQRCPK